MLGIMPSYVSGVGSKGERGKPYVLRVLTARYRIKDSSGWALGENVEKFGSPVVRAWWNLSRGGTLVGNLYRDKIRLLVGRGDKTLLEGSLDG